VTPVYSRAGNMTTMPQPASPASSYTATYDAWNRLVKIADGANTVSEYQYDGAKRRVVQKSYVSGTLNETRHLYYTEPSKWQVVEERVGTSTSANRQFVWGLRYIDDLILRDRDTDGNGTLDERLYSLQDANWNVTGLVNTSGVIQQRFVYTAYGLPVFLSSSFTSGSNTAAWEVLDAGYRFETATSLIHVRHRVLNPALGCWVQRDPRMRPTPFDLFAYANLTPYRHTDPSGLVVGTAVAACVLGAGTSVFSDWWNGEDISVCRAGVGCIVGGIFGLFATPDPSWNNCLAGIASGVISTIGSSLCTTCPFQMDLKQLGCNILGAILAGALGCAVGAGASGTSLPAEIEIMIMTVISTFLGLDVARLCDFFAN